MAPPVQKWFMAPPIQIMFYVYILLCADNKLYIGFTENLESRVSRHKMGMVQSTKPRIPTKLIFYEAYLNKYDALRREKYFKTSKGKTTLRTMLKETL